MFSVLLGAALAVANILSLEGLLQAQACGSFAYTSVIVALSAIIPSMSGPVLFGEKVTVSQFAGIGLMIICIILSPGNDGGERRAVNLKWLLFCTVAFVFSGAVGVVQKIHQNNAAHKAEMPALLLTCFFVSFALSGIRLITERRRMKKSGESLNKLTLAVLLFPAVSGLCFAAHNKPVFIGQACLGCIFPHNKSLPHAAHNALRRFRFQRKANRQAVGGNCRRHFIHRVCKRNYMSIISNIRGAECVICALFYDCRGAYGI